jgi:tetratricopeptide (TPR) repeat protein
MIRSRGLPRRTPPRPRGILRPAILAAALAALSIGTLGACGGHTDARADDLAREKAAALFNDGVYDGARAALEPLIARRGAAFEDLIRAAAIEWVGGKTEAAQALIERAAKERADAPEVLWLRGQMERESGGLEGYERALELFRKVNAARPDDLAARLALGEAEAEVGDQQRALELYESVVAVGPENGGRWYVAAVYRAARLLSELGQNEKAQRYYALRKDLEQIGVAAPDTITMGLGELARIRPPAPTGNNVARPAPLAAFGAPPPLLPELAGARELFARDLDDDGDVDLVAAGPKGVAVALSDKGTWTARPVTGEPAACVRAFDADNDGDLDLVVSLARGLVLFRCEKDAGGLARWELSPSELPALPEPPADIVAVDYDHEGDLDLLVVGGFGARLFRNDGADEPQAGGRFVDATEGSGLPTGRFDWCLTEDFDGDNDVDFLLGGAEALVLADDRRGGHFVDVAARAFPAAAFQGAAFPHGASIPSRPLVADLDGDGRPDLWPAGADAPWLQQADGTFKPSGPAAPATAPRLLADLDLDGALDLVTGGASPSVLLAAGLPV